MISNIELNKIKHKIAKEKYEVELNKKRYLEMDLKTLLDRVKKVRDRIKFSAQRIEMAEFNLEQTNKKGMELFEK